ncbi:MAG TPA: FAD-dependent oxidoreductase [Candidatus Saccharimonadales bacterium]|nr:FAD-dependent oxidoreductase [Candidatus Saccharimonadales bacterium]
MKIKFDHSENLAADIYSFYFSTESQFVYTPGQYVELSIPGIADNKRWFTLSSSPTENLLAITTRLRRKDLSQFKTALMNLQPEANLNINGPFGDFVLPMLIQTPLVFVAAGIGITPFRSILKWLRDTEETRPIKLIYGLKTEDEIIFQDLIDEPGLHTTIIIVEPSDAWGGERGHLSSEAIAGLSKITDDSMVYIAGPEKMVASLQTDLVAHGLARHQVVTDEFPNYTAI